MSMTLGKAYVQIVPTTKGIKNNIEKELSPEMDKAGGGLGSLLGNGMVSKLKTVLIAAGVGKIVKDSIMAGGELQQSLGGVETIFGKSADKMKQHAYNAFKTVGVSANEYMENVTSFGAGLVASLGGDTDKATRIANMAMMDMGDNANKMGTNMQDIQNAYQGFAKSNYTMLDNLKLGFGGTKSEMERLLKKAEELTGIEYDISNLGDVYEAIHVIQEEIGITGTTALEAEETLTGSFNAMKASFQDFIGNIAIGNGTIKQDIQNLVSTFTTFIFDNLIPMLTNVAMALPGILYELIIQGVPAMFNASVELINGLITGIQTNGPAFLEQMRSTVTDSITTIKERLPEFLERGKEFVKNMIDGIIQNGPNITMTLHELLVNLISKIVENLPYFLEKGAEFIMQLITGMLRRLPDIISSMATIIGNLISLIASKLPLFLAKGLEAIGRMALGLVRGLPQLLGTIPGIISSVLNSFKTMVTSMPGIGRDMIRGLWQGIKNMTSWITGKVKGFARSVVGGIKGALGIKSPSRVMAGEVGKFIPSGLAMGIEKNISPVSDAMDEMAEIATKDFNSDISFGTNVLDKARSYTQSGLVSMKDELSVNAEFDVNIAGQSLGKFVKTITKEQDKQDNLVLAY